MIPQKGQMGKRLTPVHIHSVIKLFCLRLNLFGTEVIYASAIAQGLRFFFYDHTFVEKEHAGWGLLTSFYKCQILNVLVGSVELS